MDGTTNTQQKQVSRAPAAEESATMSKTAQMRNETEFLAGEIDPMHSRATWKDWLGAIVFGILYIGIIYALILVIAK